MRTIIAMIKETTMIKMDEWKKSQFSFIRGLQKYCTHEIYIEAKEQGIKCSYKIHEMKKKKGYTKSIERFFHRSDENLNKMLDKEVELKLLKIDLAVAKKLAGIEIDDVRMIRFSPWSPDGFCSGSWLINGKKVFSFESFYAGGYNIQCLHVRTKYKLK